MIRNGSGMVKADKTWASLKYLTLCHGCKYSDPYPRLTDQNDLSRWVWCTKHKLMPETDCEDWKHDE